MKLHTLSIILVFLVVTCSAQYVTFFKKATLQNISTDNVRLLQITENKPFVLIFFNTECPICQKYTSILRGYADSISDVKFVMVFSKWDSLAAVKTFAADFTNDKHPVNTITFLRDPNNKLIKKLKATTTPEAFLFNKDGGLQYRGAIDNWFYALGRYRPQATEYYLKNAITQYLKNEKITVSNTNPIGCLIEY